MRCGQGGIVRKLRGDAAWGLAATSSALRFVWREFRLLLPARRLKQLRSDAGEAAWSAVPWSRGRSARSILLKVSLGTSANHLPSAPIHSDGKEMKGQLPQLPRNRKQTILFQKITEALLLGICPPKGSEGIAQGNQEAKRSAAGHSQGGFSVTSLTTTTTCWTRSALISLSFCTLLFCFSPVFLGWN